MAAKAKEVSSPFFRCLLGRYKSGDYKECRKRSDGSTRYCVRGTSLEGKDKGETFYGCYSLGDITEDYIYTKTIEETLTCEQTKHQSGENSKVLYPIFTLPFKCRRIKTLLWLKLIYFIPNRVFLHCTSQ